MPTPPRSLQDLLDRAAIADLRYAYAHGVDRRDWALYRSIFADRVEFDFFTWAGIRATYDADAWVALVKATLAPFDATQHSFTNLLITLDGDTATCVTNMTARHVLGQESQTLGGYYTDRLVRTGAGWKIVACQLMITWEEGDRGLFERAAARGARAHRRRTGGHMTGRLEGKIAFVTGGASGLGEAIARRYGAEGATVVLADIDAAAGNAVARDIGANARFVSLDVTREDQWLAAFATCERVDVLVNNAGITTFGSIEALTLDQFRHEMDTDVVSVFLGCKHVLPLMKQAGGSIINMSSLSGVRAQPDLAAYNAAKAAVTLLTKSVALHCARERYGIRCNSIHPGVIDTPITRKVLAQVDNPEEVFAGWMAVHPIGRIGRPEEIAAIALYLASDESAFTTGAEFRVDGGSSM